MLFFKSVYCRATQLLLRLVLSVLPHREPKIMNSYLKLGDLIRKRNIKSAFIVTDMGVVNNNLLVPVEKILLKNGVAYEVYDKTVTNPTVFNVEEAFEIYRKNNYDALIAIGGGSSIDCAKALGARIVYPNKTVAQLKGMLRILRSLPLFIAIPTTAGTGSETTPVAVITATEECRKYILISFSLIPNYAVIDATFTYSLPKDITFYTGMDTLTHAVEAYIGCYTTKESRNLAVDAIKLVFKNIKVACTNGYNYTARKNMLHASYEAGLAFSKSCVGYIHAVSHQISGRYGIHHGLANAIIMPYVLNFYGKKINKKLSKLSLELGLSNKNDTHKIRAEKFICAIKNLNSEMCIPNKIACIKREDIDIMAKYAEKEANPFYPVPKLMTLEELKSLYYEISV